jgi:uncharacterized membrane protein YadS
MTAWLAIIVLALFGFCAAPFYFLYSVFTGDFSTDHDSQHLMIGLSMALDLLILLRFYFYKRNENKTGWKDFFSPSFIILFLLLAGIFAFIFLGHEILSGV